MVSETAAKASSEGGGPKKRDRCVQRTVDLGEAEIAVVAAAVMRPPDDPHHVSKAGPADT